MPAKFYSFNREIRYAGLYQFEKGKLCKAIHLDVPIFFLIAETGGTVIVHVSFDFLK